MDARSCLVASTIAWGLLPTLPFAHAEDPAGSPKPVAGVQIVQGAGGANPAPPADSKPADSKPADSKPAAPQPNPDPVDPQDPAVRLLFLAAGGPLVVEMKLTLDGAPYAEARERLVDRMLSLSDTNRDGRATWEEAVANPAATLGRTVYFGNLNPQQRTQYLQNFDTNGDGSIDRVEARRFLAQQFGGGAFALQPGFGGATVDLLKILDADGDGTLAVAEIDAAEARLVGFDADDDELLTMADFGPAAPGRPNAFYNPGARPGAQGVVMLAPERSDAGVHQALVARYGALEARPDRPLSVLFPRESELGPKLDADGNGQISAAETAALASLPADVLLEANFGASGDLPAGLRVTRVAPALGTWERSVRQEGTGWIIEFSGQKLAFSLNAATAGAAPGFAAQAEAMLKQYDSDGNGYIEKSELNPMLANQLAAQVAAWDQNQDGKVYAEEIKQFLEQQSQPFRTALRCLVTDQSQALLPQVDTNGDGAIGRREMKHAAARIRACDRDGDGRLTAAEIPGTMTVQLAHGGGAYYGGGVGAVRTPGAATRAENQGPAWFVRMDRNGDGDISRREFLGSEEQFRKLDADGDGFLDRHEAAATGK